MTRPSPPRLPELAGMTEAGFNRVVAMVTHWDFVPRHGFGSEAAYSEWRASLPKSRNKKQRKADVMLKAFRSVHSESFERSQAERVADYWDGFAQAAADIGNTPLWQTAKRGADRIRTLRELEAIAREHAELFSKCQKLEGCSDVRWALESAGS